MAHIDNGIPIEFAPHEAADAALPEVTDVQRLTLRPGDAIVLRVPSRISAQIADVLKERVRAKLGLGPDVPILILDGDISIEVAGTAGEVRGYKIGDRVYAPEDVTIIRRAVP